MFYFSRTNITVVSTAELLKQNAVRIFYSFHRKPRTNDDDDTPHLPYRVPKLRGPYVDVLFDPSRSRCRTAARIYVTDETYTECIRTEINLRGNSRVCIIIPAKSLTNSLRLSDTVTVETRTL